MKCLFVWLVLTVAAYATNAGDTYEQVIAEKGKPKSQASVGANRILNYPDVTIQLRGNAVVSIKSSSSGTAAEAATPQKSEPLPATEKPEPEPRTPEEKIASLQKKRASAVEQVKTIVNRPVRSIPRSKVEDFSNFSEGWFHAGAITPDFNTVDVRTTQKLDYDKYPYVSSPLNPTVVFVGRELEFNSMTKFFYVDRTLPKKKLTAAEMLEINRLYRIIGQCDTQLRNVAVNKP